MKCLNTFRSHRMIFHKILLQTNMLQLLNIFLISLMNQIQRYSIISLQYLKHILSFSNYCL